MAVSLLLLAGCGAGDNAVTTTTGNPTTTSEPAVVVGDVTLTRSGGFAGFLTTVTVREDGVVIVVDNSEPPSESLLPETELHALHELVTGPDFAALLETYVPPEGVCCDFFFYEVTAEVGDRTIKSATADTIETPPALQQVIDLLSGLMP